MNTLVINNSCHFTQQKIHKRKTPMDKQMRIFKRRASCACCVVLCALSIRATQQSSWDLHWKPRGLAPLIRLSIKRDGDAKAGPGAVSPSLRWPALQSAIRREPKSVQPAFPYADPLLPSMCVSLEERDRLRKRRDNPRPFHLIIFTGFMVTSKNSY